MAIGSKTSGSEQGPSTASREITVGVIAPPGRANRHAEKLAEMLPQLLTERVDDRVSWSLRVITDPLAGLGDELEMLDETRRIVQREGWDFGVCLTDLPVYRVQGTPGHSGRLVVADVSYQRGIAALSLPPLGVWSLRTRLRQAILRLIGELQAGESYTQHRDRESALGDDTDDETPQERESATAGQLMSRRFTTHTVPTRRRERHELEPGIDTRFVSPAWRGHLRMWMSMVAANRPWALFHNFTAVIALALATGVYGMIFQSVYYLTDYFGPIRLLVTMLGSMTAMVIWIILSHGLWEPTLKPAGSLPMAGLYNWVTVLTLIIAVWLAYAALYLLLLLAAVLFVPEPYLEKTLGHSVGAGRYFLLAWITTSIATLAGALGAGLESDEAVRQATFGIRQQSRQELVQRERGEQSSGSDQPGDPDR